MASARNQQQRQPSPSGSLTASALAEEEAIIDNDDNDADNDADNDVAGASMSYQARRRSSVGHRFAAMADLGGANSFRSFARSWRRAANFPEVIPRQPSFVLSPDQGSTTGDEVQYFSYRGPHEPPSQHTSLLAQHFGRLPSPEGEPSAGGPGLSPARDIPSGREGKALEAEMAVGALPVGSPSSRSSIFAAPPHLATPSIIGSYGSLRSSHYGTVGRMRSRSSLARRGSWAVRPDRDAAADEDPDDDDVALGEDQPILVKEVKQGDKFVLAVDGQSTLPQSVFNSINALIGVGLLSLPLALRMSGWLIGLSLLTLMALVATHTGKLLGKCMEVDASIITYSDLAYICFGARARLVISALFTLELIGACVALVILFADSLDLLLPGVASVDVWKCVCAALVLVLNTMPLRWLSYTSVVGIFSTFGIVCIVLVDGLTKRHTPGSLLEPATTHLLPSNWLALPLAYGLLASPWGAHCVFPSIYRDMRFPHQWRTGVNVAFSFSYALDMSLAVVGILMFGDGTQETITANIIQTSGFPRASTVLMCVFIAIIPLTKIPLNSRPLVTTADVVCGLRGDGGPGRSPAAAGVLRAAVRVAVVVVLLVISVLFPAFDSVCAFLGAALCSLISIVLPLCFYLRLYRDRIAWPERLLCWLLLSLFALLGSVGTVWACLPRRLVGSY